MHQDWDSEEPETDEDDDGGNGSNDAAEQVGDELVGQQWAPQPWLNLCTMLSIGR